MSQHAIQRDKVEKQLLLITQNFLSELDRHKSAEKLTLKSDLTKEGSIDSLGRVELFHRIEQTFGILLPQDLMVQGKCLNDFVSAVIDAKPHDIVQALHAPLQRTEAIADHQLPTLSDAFIHLSDTKPDRTQIFLYIDGKTQPLTYADLRKNAEKVCAYLQYEGIQKGDRVAIMLPTCKEFFYTFMGIQLAGAIPVPIYPPMRPEMIEEYALREAKILENAGVRILVTFDRAKKLSNMLGILINTLKKVVNASTMLTFNGPANIIKVGAEHPGLIQYTSGSTSLPKGVLLSHANLVSNIHAIKDAIQMSHTDMGVSWLPLYHDMGLIGSWLNSMYHAVPIVIMSPLDFLVRPESWLWAIHNFRGTLSAAPNFAYELCIKKISEERLQGLDLSSWRLSFNGAEAVRAQTLRDFSEKFAKYGLKHEALCPVYGLAENSVCLTVPEIGPAFKTDKVKKEPFEKEHVAIPAQNKEPYHEFVNCGKAIIGHKMRVVDENDNLLPDRKVGRFQFTGPSQMVGYHNNVEATKKCTTKDGWIDTGDLAYLVDGEVYIVGRKKDLIIKAGRNFYPEEIEDIVTHIRGVRKGCIVAFGVQEAQLGTEKMIIVAESRVKHNVHKKKIAHEITSKVTIALGVAPDDVVIAPPRSVPKTSSGKLQRAQCKALYMEGKLGKKRLPLVAQIGKIWWRTVSVRCAKICKRIVSYIYTVYANLIVGVTGVLLFLSSLLLPRKLNIKFAKKWVRFGFRLMFCKINFNQPHNWPKGVFIANHQSYLDAAVLFSILPENTTFIGKKSLSRVPVLNFILKRIGVLLVERADVKESLKDLEKILHSTAHSDQSLVIFPEGTFTEKKGVHPFKMGAFQIAAYTNRDIIPIAIHDTREILRAYQWRMCPGTIKVELFSPIALEGTEWSNLLACEKHSRKIIADALNEPLLDDQ